MAKRPVKYHLGDKVTFNRMYLRRHNFSNPNCPRKFWQDTPINQRDGIFLGIRVIQEGSVDYFDGGSQFNRENSITCALIAYSETRSPIYVPLYNLTFSE